MVDRSKAILLLVLLISNLNFGLASPFLPTFLADRGVSTSMIGIIFAAFSIAATISSLLIGKVVDRWSHKTVIILSCLLMAACVIGFEYVF